jgi:hypothetical protein
MPNYLPTRRSRTVGGVTILPQIQVTSVRVCICLMNTMFKRVSLGCQLAENSTTHSAGLKVDETGALFGLAAVTVKNVSFTAHTVSNVRLRENTGGVLS